MEIKKHFDVRVNDELRAKLIFLHKRFQQNSIGKIHYTDVFRMALERLYEIEVKKGEPTNGSYNG